MKAKIIYNPKSGKRKLQPQMSYVIEQLSAVGYENVEVYPTQGAGDAVRAASRSCEEGTQLIIAVGGDGTISEVVSGISRHSKRPLLGYIPSGTSNDFASALRIPADVRKAMQVITKGRRVQIDIGRFNESKTFNYIVAAGAFTRLTYTTPHHLKRLLGVWAYLKDFFRELALISKPFRLELRVDGKKIDGEFVIALIINSPNFAGMRRVIPKAVMDDGIFDILLLPKSNPKVFWAAVRSMAMGVTDAIQESGIMSIQGSNISIRAEKPLAWNIDGELGGQGPISIQCQKQFLDIMVPESAINHVLQNQSDSNAEVGQSSEKKAGSKNRRKTAKKSLPKVEKKRKTRKNTAKAQR